MTRAEEINAALAAMEVARRTQANAFAGFIQASQERDWELAESLRLAASANFEALMDHYTLACRLVADFGCPRAR